jgi:nitrite reductase/ring-hydroxylating ferredoxin subunit
MDGRVLRCAWHQWEFDIESGTALFEISTVRLTYFPVCVVEGDVFVELKPTTRVVGHIVDG